MFKIADDFTYTWPVTVKKPVDGGKFQEETFTAKFKFIDQDRIDELTGPGADKLRRRTSEPEPDNDLLKVVLVGWGDDVVGENDQPLPFSEASRDRLLKIGYVRLALIGAFFSSVTGVASKN